MDFISLEESFQGAESVYDGETIIKKSDPSLIFDLAFADNANQFLNQLAQQNVPNTQSQIKNTPKWEIQSKQDPQFSQIKQRKINIKSTENGFTFFVKKNINTNIIQKLFITNNKYILFSIMKSIVDGKLEDFKIIDKWILSKQQENTTIKIDGRIIWRNSQNVSQTLMRSKWFRYYQNRFEKWRLLVIKKVTKYYADIEKRENMKPYLGTWNKLNTFFDIEITIDEITYRDGSKFKLSFIENENESFVRAKYADGFFDGRLEKPNLTILHWSNGSVWIKNGFHRFKGNYIYNGINIEINEKGFIKFDDDEKKYEFMLIGKRSIAYHKDLKAIKGTLGNDGDLIKWDNNTIWNKKDVIKTDIKSDDTKIECYETKTGEEEGYESDGLMIKIEKLDHFVDFENEKETCLIDDDDILITKSPENDDYDWQLVDDEFDVEVE